MALSKSILPNIQMHKEQPKIVSPIKSTISVYMFWLNFLYPISPRISLWCSRSCLLSVCVGLSRFFITYTVSPWQPGIRIALYVPTRECSSPYSWFCADISDWHFSITWNKRIWRSSALLWWLPPQFAGTIFAVLKATHFVVFFSLLNGQLIY